MAEPATREARNAAARARYAARKQAAEPQALALDGYPPEDYSLEAAMAHSDATGEPLFTLKPSDELVKAVTVSDPLNDGPVFAEPQADRVPGAFDKAEWDAQQDIKTPEGRARALLVLAQTELRDAKKLLDKYEEHLRWRSNPAHPERHHLAPKYEALVAEYKLTVARAEAELAERNAAVDLFAIGRRAAERAGWDKLGHAVAGALAFGPARDDEKAVNSGHTIWNPAPDMAVRYSRDGTWHVGLIDADDKWVFGYDADIYSPRLGHFGEAAVSPVAASWGSYSGMKSPAANRAMLRVLTLATRIAEAVTDYFGAPRSLEGDPS